MMPGDSETEGLSEWASHAQYEGGSPAFRGTAAVQKRYWRNSLKLPDYVKDRYWRKSYPPGLSLEYPIPRVSLPDFVGEAMGRNPSRTAMVYSGRELNYAELREKIDRFAAALHGRGVRKGDTVALFLPNCPQFAYAYYGALKIGLDGYGHKSALHDAGGGIPAAGQQGPNAGRPGGVLAAGGTGY